MSRDWMHKAAATPVTEIQGPSLADFLRALGRSEHRLFVCDSRRRETWGRPGDLWLSLSGSSGYDLDGENCSIRLLESAIDSRLIGALPSTLLRRIADTDLIVVDAKLAGARVRELFQALDFSGRS